MNSCVKTHCSSTSGHIMFWNRLMYSRLSKNLLPKKISGIFEMLIWANYFWFSISYFILKELPQIWSNSNYRHGWPLYRILRARGRKWNMSWGTEKTQEVLKMTGNGGDHVLCTTVYFFHSPDCQLIQWVVGCSCSAYITCNTVLDLWFVDLRRRQYLG